MRKVTRTIDTTICTVIFVNIADASTYTENVSLLGRYDDKEKALKAVSKSYNTDERKAFAVSEMITVSNLYEMPEEQFITVANCVGEGRERKIK